MINMFLICYVVPENSCCLQNSFFKVPANGDVFFNMNECTKLNIN